MYDKRLVRNMQQKMICGVCAGIADYLGMDVTVVRLIAVAAALFSASLGVFAYLIAAFVMPEGER